MQKLEHGLNRAAGAFFKVGLALTLLAVLVIVLVGVAGG